MEKQYDVFISYRRVGGKEIARNVQLALQKDTNWKVFLDFDDLDEGRFDPKIMAAIEEAPTFIVVLTTGALDCCAKENDWMRKEILYAHQLGKDIIPLEVDKCYHDDKMSTIPKIVGEVIGVYQFAALDTETLFRESIEKLIIRIRKGGKKVKKGTESGATIHVVNDYPCWVYHFRKEMLLAKTEEDNVLHLRKGRHLLEFKAVDCPQAIEAKKVEITDEDIEDMVEVSLKEKVEAIQKKAEEQRIAEEERKRRKEEEQAKERAFTIGSVSFKMIRVEGGRFQMGSPINDHNAYVNEKPQHWVTLNDFYIGEVVVTQALWKAVMGNNPSTFFGENNPVENVSWDDCQEFIKTLNSKTGQQFRLPTEAEWEYAARGGNKSKGYKYAGGNTIDDVAWFNGNSDFRTHQVKNKQPNELGLYDMSGNVYEWCLDWYSDTYYEESPSSNPQNITSGLDRILRGSSWINRAKHCRVANRYKYNPLAHDSSIGFRLVLPQ